MAESSNDKEIVAALLLIKNMRSKRKRKASFMWVLNLYQEKDEKGAYRMLIERFLSSTKSQLFVFFFGIHCSMTSIYF